MNGFLTILFEMLGLILLIGLSAFFSSSEMSLFSLSRAKILSYKNDPLPAKRRIYLLMDNYHRTLITIIFGNMFVNGAISMLNDELLSKMPFTGLWITLVSALSSVLLLLLFGEISPMTIAYVHCESWSPRVATPIYYFRKVLFPVTFLVEHACNWILDRLGRRANAPLSHEEYLSYLDSCVEHGGFSREEAELLKETFSLREKLVEEIMRPRVDLEFIRYSSDADNVLETIRRSRQPYIPVAHDNTLDSTDTLISSRNFFDLSPAERKQWRKSGIIMPAVFIPGKCTLTKALHSMRMKNENAALVADEYGGVRGMLTLEDIYSELAGKSVELDDRQEQEFVKLSEDTWIFDGLCPLDFVRVHSAWTNCGLCEEAKSNTLSGFFCEKFGALPQINDHIHIGNVEMKALAVDKNRVTRIQFKIENISDEEGEMNL